jgi:hypothetical protein
VPLVGACLAEVHGVEPEHVRATTAASAAAVFGLPLD